MEEIVPNGVAKINGTAIYGKSLIQLKGYIRELIQGIYSEMQQKFLKILLRDNLDLPLRSHYLSMFLKLFLDLPVHIESTENWFEMSSVSLSWFCHMKLSVLSVRDTMAQYSVHVVVMVCLSLFKCRYQIQKK